MFDQISKRLEARQSNILTVFLEFGNLVKLSCERFILHAPIKEIKIRWKEKLGIKATRINQLLMGLGKPINNQIPYHISLHIKTTKFLIKKKKTYAIV